MVRVELALVSKSIVEARAKGNQAVRKGEQAGATSLNSDELITPTRTDEAIAKIAGVGKDTVRRVEAMQAVFTLQRPPTCSQNVPRMFPEHR